jgi:ephrin-B
LAPDVPDMTKFTSVEEWLASIKMTRYLENFQRAGVNNIEAVMRLSLQELQLIGVSFNF